MSGIQTGIELNDQFSGILSNIINSVNLAVSAMYDMQESMNADIDTSSIEGAREEINRATAAINEMSEAMNAALNNQATPDAAPPVVDESGEPIPVPLDPIPPDPLVENPDPVPLPIQPNAPPEPVEVPVHWETDGLEVFTSTGVDRFRQEVQSANSMLEQLSSTQDAIARQAYNTNLFPPESFQDLNRLAVRVDHMRERIQQIENNPVNLGTDTANAELEQLRAQLNRMVQEQNELNEAMQNMDVSAANDAYLRLSQLVSGTERYIRDNVDEQGRFNREIEEGTHQASELTDTIKNAVLAYVSIQSIGNALNISDELMQTISRLNMMNDGVQSTQELVNMVYAAAQDARGSFSEMADVVARFGNNAKDAFSSSEEVVAFADLIQKQMTIAGASTQEASNAMLQLSQALGSGTLRGDELNSIFEQAPNLIQSIADYLDVPIGKIREMASEGELSADVVKAAIFADADEINAKFNEMPMTWGQIWQSMQNTALIAFQPVLQRLNDIANSQAFQTFVNGAIEAMATLANILLNIFDLVATVGGFIADNWSIISPIIYGIIGALMTYAAYLGIVKGIELATAAASAVMAVGKGLVAAATMIATGATWAQTTAQMGLNGAMYACPIVWIIMLIIALIALFYAAVAAVNKFAGTSVSATGVIAGVFAVLGAHIANTFIVPTWNGFASLANFFGNVFNNPVAAVKVLFYDMCLTVIGYIQNLASAIETLLNKIPGVTVDITSGLDNFYSGLEQAQQAVKDESGWVEYVQKMDFIDYTSAWDAGYSFGEGIDESISNFDPSSLFGTTDIPSADDYASALTAGGIGSGVDDIAGNTGAMADAMDITGEELKYMRDIAEQEAINRYTTAEIKVDMSGMQNTVNSGDDIDGFMTKLTDSVNEAVDNMTEGVHE